MYLYTHVCCVMRSLTKVERAPTLFILLLCTMFQFTSVLNLKVIKCHTFILEKDKNFDIALFWRTRVHCSKAV